MCTKSSRVAQSKLGTQDVAGKIFILLIHVAETFNDRQLLAEDKTSSELFVCQRRREVAGGADLFAFYCT